MGGLLTDCAGWRSSSPYLPYVLDCPGGPKSSFIALSFSIELKIYAYTIVLRFTVN